MGASQPFSYLNHQCRMEISSRGYRMGISGSIPVEDAHTASYIKLSYAEPSQHELPSRVQFLLRAPVCKNQTNSKFRGEGGKFKFFHILMLHRPGYN